MHLVDLQKEPCTSGAAGGGGRAAAGTHRTLGRQRHRHRRLAHLPPLLPPAQVDTTGTMQVVNDSTRIARRSGRHLHQRCRGATNKAASSTRLQQRQRFRQQLQRRAAQRRIAFKGRHRLLSNLQHKEKESETTNRVCSWWVQAQNATPQNATAAPPPQHATNRCSVPVALLGALADARTKGSMAIRQAHPASAPTSARSAAPVTPDSSV